MAAKILVLFDVDGTLTPARKLIEDNMKCTLENLKKHVAVGIVGGSDYGKIKEQLGGEDIPKFYDYVFAENGVVGYKKGELISAENIVSCIGDDNLQKVINFALKYMSELQLPRKRGTFVEFRSSMINLCPIGRSCSYDERLEFVALDKAENIRLKFLQALRKEFPDVGLQFAIGGQISIDVFPIGWDKTYCLRHIPANEFDQIYFFGDKTQPGGNDHEIFNSERTIGHTVTSPEDTVCQLKKLFPQIA
ncbi:Phosphomannomutase 2 [Trichoplax sp. H2]|nr:Phosphomannomutase 2 [Trichoplax sp. H2]|eukprot:RDD39851.1 Phosphomannomutase 2 [Trichoplax sp. H2]